MYSLLPLLALLPAALGAPAPQAAPVQPSQIDPAVFSSISSSISSSLVREMACTPKVTSSTSSRAASTTSRSSSTTSTTSTARPSSSSTSRASSTVLPSSSSSSSSLTPPPQATNWWKPSLSNTFLYELDKVAIQAPTVTTNTGVKLTKDIYIVDLEGHSKAQIAAYKAKGKKVVCYVSAGSWEPWRGDAKSFDPACYCGKDEPFDAATGLCKNNKNKMGDWDEWWLDVKTPACVTNIKSVMANRIKAAKEKGCDGLDPDNVDSYANGVTYGTTAQNQVDYLTWFAQEAHNNGMAIGLKNSGNLLSSWEGVATQWQAALTNTFDFSVIESCVRYKECHIYDSFLKAGKPQIRVEYSNSIKTCPAKTNGVTFSVYSGLTLDTKKITLDCP